MRPGAGSLLRLLSRPRELACALQGMRGQASLPASAHLKLCADWLLHCQAQGDDAGYAASFSLISGWAGSYIETTGYIIPTMLDIAAALGDVRYRDSALRAGEWLLQVQQPDGSFTDSDDKQPQVFDTGQDLLGLNRLYRETSDERFRVAARKAGDWLIRVQDKDGSWSTMGLVRGKPCAYHTRVAAALIELGQLANDERYAQSGVANLRWATSRQLDNGFFRDSELHVGDVSVLHTMVYVLEGFLLAYQLTGEQRWREALLRGAAPLKVRNLHHEVVLCSQYDEGLHPLNSEKCIPGLAQWANLCFDLHRMTGDGSYLEAMVLSLFYLKSKQILCEGTLRGALPASVPVWGYYHPMMFPNWANKFFADALLKYRTCEWPVWREQETWVRKCFELQLDGGGWERFADILDPMDDIILDQIEAALDSNGQRELRILDLGCGKGRYIRALGVRRPRWNVSGIDPFYHGGEFDIQCGSAYSIPFPDGTFDAVYSSIALQHVSDVERAFSEILRVLKPAGALVVADRNLLSGRGLLKPYHELRGMWMYPWDSPFRERWYTSWQWRRMLASAGFVTRRVENIRNSTDRGWRRLLHMNDILLVHAERR